MATQTTRKDQEQRDGKRAKRARNAEPKRKIRVQPRGEADVEQVHRRVGDEGVEAPTRLGAQSSLLRRSDVLT
jgi:hypothetical protein